MISKLKGHYKMWGLVKSILNKWALYVKFVQDLAKTISTSIS